MAQIILEGDNRPIDLVVNTLRMSGVDIGVIPERCGGVSGYLATVQRIVGIGVVVREGEDLWVATHEYDGMEWQ